MASIFFPYQLIFMKQPKLMNKNEFLEWYKNQNTFLGA